MSNRCRSLSNLFYRFSRKVYNSYIMQENTHRVKSNENVYLAEYEHLTIVRLICNTIYISIDLYRRDPETYDA